MKGGVPYLVWRDGRPRWSPGPRLRQAGWRGRDLKDPEGNWLDPEAAAAAASDLNKQAAGAGLPISLARPRKRQKGFVYFLRAGDFVKIGFTSHPTGRARELQTGLPGGIDFIVAVSGSREDEQRLHGELSMHHVRGEWFRAVPAVLATITRSVGLGRAMLAAAPSSSGR